MMLRLVSRVRLRPRRHASLWVLLTLALLLLVSAESSRFFTLPEQTLSVIWPPAGILLGALLVYGWRSLLAAAPALLIWSLFLQQAPWLFALLFCTGMLLGSVFAARLIQLGTPLRSRGLTLRFVLNLYLRGALVGSGLVSLFGALGYWLTHPDNLFALHDIWLLYWGFEALGVILFTPLALLLMSSRHRYVSRLLADLRQPRLLLWLVFSLLAAGLTLLLESQGQRLYATALAYTFFPLLCWLVMVARSETLVLALPVFVALFVAFALRGWGGVTQIEDFQGLVRMLTQVAGMVIMAQLIAAVNTERSQLLQLFRRQAREDYLTGLDNERELVRHLSGLLQKKAPDLPKQLWLVDVDLLDFEELADQMGFEGAHGLERQLASQLRELRRPDMQQARLGPGRYLLVLSLADRLAVHDLLDQLYARLNDQVFVSAGQSTRIRVSLGAVPLDGSITTPAGYLAACHQATLQARQRSRRILVADTSQGLMAERQQLSQRFEALKQALPDKRLRLFAQPILDLSGKASGQSYEILLRMMSVDGQLLPPVEFLPAAERFGYMQDIDRWVVQHTLQTLADHPGWLAQTRKCAINLSGASLSDLELVPYIRSVLEATGVPAEKISFEVTESERIQSTQRAARQIHDLRALGCSVALDDFGTGLATFEYLKAFEFDYLKIDGAFIRNLEQSAVDQAMVQGTCAVARSLGLQTIAEFVEGESLIARLKTLGVNHAQGYGVGKPVPLAELFQHIVKPCQA
ncbi:sensor domain-containing phosphodiesterase [Marinospirillum alkaliphilum]|nr:EAL domain-containing protein [Marinospirillum alkaliphilum]